MTLLYQEEVLFSRHADIANGEYISVEKTRKLLGKAATAYAINFAKGHKNSVLFGNFYGLRGHETIPVLTLRGFSKAFDYFYMSEIAKGKHNAYQEIDYLSRDEFK